MIRLSEKRSVDYKNGYYVVSEHSITGENSKNPGEECVCSTQTYPSVNATVNALILDGELRSVITECCEQSIAEYLAKESKRFVSAKAAKERTKECKWWALN